MNPGMPITREILSDGLNVTEGWVTFVPEKRAIWLGTMAEKIETADNIRIMILIVLPLGRLNFILPPHLNENL